MHGADLVRALSRKLTTEREKSPPVRAVAEYLGVSVPTVYTLQKKPSVRPKDVAHLLKKVERRASQQAYRESIRPIVEFYRIEKAISSQGKRWELFNVRDGGTVHPYKKGLRDELEHHHGIYLFYDSRGAALYAGKARRLSLWAEMNNAFNRPRAAQKIMRVEHPIRRQVFQTSNEKRRQIRPRQLELHDVAAYVSAYSVPSGLIENLESMLIRGFTNDLLNTKVENLGWDAG